MQKLPARKQGAIGLATVKVMGVNSADCLEHMHANGLEFAPSDYSLEHATMVTARLAENQIPKLFTGDVPSIYGRL